MEKSIDPTPVPYPLPLAVIGAMKPVLFDFPDYEYLQTGGASGRRLSFRQKD